MNNIRLGSGYTSDISKLNRKGISNKKGRNQVSFLKTFLINLTKQFSHIPNAIMLLY